MINIRENEDLNKLNHSLWAFGLNKTYTNI